MCYLTRHGLVSGDCWEYHTGVTSPAAPLLETMAHHLSFLLTTVEAMPPTLLPLTEGGMEASLIPGDPLSSQRNPHSLHTWATYLRRLFKEIWMPYSRMLRYATLLAMSTCSGVYLYKPSTIMGLPPQLVYTDPPPCGAAPTVTCSCIVYGSRACVCL